MTVFFDSRGLQADSRTSRVAEETPGRTRPTSMKPCSNMAERVRFELTVELPLQRFSRPSPSTARPPLHYLFQPLSARTCLKIQLSFAGLRIASKLLNIYQLNRPCVLCRPNLPCIMCTQSFLQVSGRPRIQSLITTSKYIHKPFFHQSIPKQLRIRTS